jgi:hypothetical protein
MIEKLTKLWRGLPAAHKGIVQGFLIGILLTLSMSVLAEEADESTVAHLAVCSQLSQMAESDAAPYYIGNLQQYLPEYGLLIGYNIGKVEGAVIAQAVFTRVSIKEVATGYFIRQCSESI